MGTYKQIKKEKYHAKHKLRLNMHAQKNTLGPTGLYELVLVAVHMENFKCTAYMPGTISTALSSFSHDQHHETDAAKRKGGGTNRSMESVYANMISSSITRCWNAVILRSMPITSGRMR